MEKNTFVNSFSDDLDKSNLYNAASGGLVSNTAAECMLLYEEKSKEIMSDFQTRNNGTHTNDRKFFNQKPNRIGKAFHPVQ